VAAELHFCGFRDEVESAVRSGFVPEAWEVSLHPDPVERVFASGGAGGEAAASSKGVGSTPHFPALGGGSCPPRIQAIYWHMELRTPISYST